MELGAFLNTHGVSNRTETDWFHQQMDADEMRPIESAQMAEGLGYHSVWMGDHVALPEASPGSLSPIRRIGGEIDRHYPERPNILDGVVVQGAIAASTERIKMGSSVYIAPYRHPLNDARQFGTIDYLSGGRMIMGAGAGWIQEEFLALGHDYYANRREVLEECIDVYRLAWQEGIVTYSGKYFDIKSMGVFPVPTSQPPIIIGTYTKPTARIAARKADGIMPPLVLPSASPEQFQGTKDELARECERIGRPTSELAIMALASFRITGPDDEEAVRRPRRNLGGTAEQILTDLSGFAEAGFSMINMAPVCPSRTYAEYEEQIQRLGEEVLPEAKSLVPGGDWRTDI